MLLQKRRNCSFTSLSTPFPARTHLGSTLFVGVKVWNPFPEVIQGETNANCCVWLQNHLDSCRIPPSQSFDECVLVMVSIRFKSVYKQSVYQKQFSELARKCYPVPWMRLNSQARISKHTWVCMGMYGSNIKTQGTQGTKDFCRNYP